MRWVNVQEIYADGKHNACPTFVAGKTDTTSYSIPAGGPLKRSFHLPPVFYRW